MSKKEGLNKIEMRKSSGYRCMTPLSKKNTFNESTPKHARSLIFSKYKKGNQRVSLPRKGSVRTKEVLERWGKFKKQSLFNERSEEKKL